MNRRDFLKYMGTAVVTTSILPLWGCGSSTSTSASPRAYKAGLRNLDYDSSGNIYELLPSKHTLKMLDSSDKLLWSVSGLDVNGGIFNYPTDVIFGKDGLLYVLEMGSGEIEIINKKGERVKTISSSLLYPTDLALDANGNVYVSDSSNNTIIVFDRNGQQVRQFGQFGTDGAYLNDPEGIDFDSAGNLHVVDAGNCRVQIYNSAGIYQGSYGSRGTGEGSFQNPGAIVVDENDFCYVADGSTGYVSVFRKGAFVKRYAPSFSDGKPAVPRNFSLAPDGTLYIQALVGFDEKEFLAKHAQKIAMKGEFNV